MIYNRTTATNLVKCPNCGEWIYPQQFHPIECCESHKEGIKEAVEWAETHKLHAGNISIPSKIWLTKLEEWRKR